MKRNIISLIASLTLLVGPISSVSLEAEKEYTIKDAIATLIDSKNYTITLESKAGPLKIESNMYYTEKGFYDDYLGDEYGYVLSDDGAYYFDLYEREFTPSALLKDDNGEVLHEIWNQGLFVGFNRLRINEFDTATSKTFKASSKRVKLAFMDMFKIDAGNYPSINPVEFEVANDVNSLKFVFSTSTGIEYKGEIHNVGTTKIDIIDEYTKENSYFKTDEELAHIIDLFSDYNYTRIVYDSDADTEEETNQLIGGYEYFNERYYYSEFSNEFIAKGKGYSIGVISIDKTYGPYTENETEYGPFNFKGGYYCWLTDGELDILTSFPINTDPFVPNIYVYPTFLKMFTNNQYLQKLDDGRYYTYKLACVDDFVSNFQITDTLNEYGAVGVGVYVKYLENGSVDFKGTEGKETVILSLEYNYYGILQTIDYAFVDFGTTEKAVFSEANVDKVIEDTIDKYIAQQEAKKGSND